MHRPASITYDGLPISSGGAHQLRTRGFIETAASLNRFISAICIESAPADVTLELVQGEENSKGNFVRLYNEFCAEFGSIKFTRSIGEYVGHQWFVGDREVSKLADRLEKLRPISLAGYAGWQVVLHVHWNLRFSEGQTEIPFQNRSYYNDFEVGWQMYLGESRVYARISEKSTAALFLSIPFDETSTACIQLAQRIRDAFPVRLSEKHWKRWSLSKSGNSYVGRRIAAPFIQT